MITDSQVLQQNLLQTQTYRLRDTCSHTDMFSCQRYSPYNITYWTKGETLTGSISNSKFLFKYLQDYLVPAAPDYMVKNSTANAGDIRNGGLIPGLGRSPGGGHGNPLQYSCLENPMDKTA